MELRIAEMEFVGGIQMMEHRIAEMGHHRMELRIVEMEHEKHYRRLEHRTAGMGHRIVEMEHWPKEHRIAGMEHRLREHRTAEKELADCWECKSFEKICKTILMKLLSHREPPLEPCPLLGAPNCWDGAPYC